MKNHAAIRVGIVLLMANLCQAGSQSRSAQVDALFPPSSPGPGAVVAVVDHGRVVLEKAYGLANVGAKLPLTVHSVFDLASVSKQFTAMGIMILAQEGRLNLNDSICKFFPEFSPFGCAITLRHLLNHTSGLPDYEHLFRASGLVATNYPRAAKEARDTYEPTSRDALRLMARQGKLRFKPGDKWEYSDSGYVVLAQVIEKVSGESYGRFLAENIFRPAGMTETVVYDETRPEIARRAVSYQPVKNEFKPIDYTPLNLIYGDGNVNTTVGDMIKWDNALTGDKLVHRATLQEAFTRGALNNGTKFDYGFGWALRKRHNTETTEHNGSWVGFRSGIVRFSQRQLTIIILSNSAGFPMGEMEKKIEAIYWDEP
ncbi:MAG TPA: serine hydrolase domain-containing protein [Candidatus Saccharimonadales bacterium]|nr:serine hydrolase domain-containing protein [Candidatus Saccharimonadales bacterium]